MAETKDTPPLTTVNLAELFHESPEVNAKALEMIIENAPIMDLMKQFGERNDAGKNTVHEALFRLLLVYDNNEPINLADLRWQLALPADLIDVFKAKIEQAKASLSLQPKSL